MSGENWNTQTLAILSNHSYAKPEILKTFISWPPRFCTNSQNCPQVVRTWNKKYLLSTLLFSLDFSKSKTSFHYTHLFHKFFFMNPKISTDYLYPSLTSILSQPSSLFPDLNISRVIFTCHHWLEDIHRYLPLYPRHCKKKKAWVFAHVCVCLWVHYHCHGNQQVLPWLWCNQCKHFWLPLWTPPLIHFLSQSSLCPQHHLGL